MCAPMSPKDADTHTANTSHVAPAALLRYNLFAYYRSDPVNWITPRRSSVLYYLEITFYPQ